MHDFQIKTCYFHGTLASSSLEKLLLQIIFPSNNNNNKDFKEREREKKDKNRVIVNTKFEEKRMMGSLYVSTIMKWYIVCFTVVYYFYWILFIS